MTLFNFFQSFAVFPEGKMGAFATKAKLLSKRKLAKGFFRVLPENYIAIWGLCGRME
jgi:hypothetical protein